ncbi:MAG: redox-regulated ATPase YchF [Candidatus Heimdallarchaeota archaeon]|nr:MAG: redox-regulated ATPase YchF [Candidatus Heimdallarchaeota archaeon]
MSILIGIVGKPSSGKTTFLNALCGTSAKTADYPFTTIQPNQGVGFVTTPCVCQELGVTCNPRNSECIDRVRKIPIKIIDVAGLVPGAYEGKGMGNQFLSDLAQADILIHVVDISGSLNEEGETVDPGSHDPMKDVNFLENEIAAWIRGILKKDWDRAVRKADTEKKNIVDFITDKMTGLKITRTDILKAVNLANLNTSTVKDWTDDDLLQLCHEIRKAGKPIIIAANKIDRPTAKSNYDRLKKEFGEIIIPTSALTDIVLKNLVNQSKVEYISASGRLNSLGNMSPKEESIVNKIQTEILEPYGTTGIFETLNKAVFNILQLQPIYPVADVTHFSDNDGKILPDVFLVKKGTTIKEFAGIIHQDLFKNFIHGIDARTNRRTSEKHELQFGDVVKIVAAA